MSESAILDTLKKLRDDIGENGDVRECRRVFEKYLNENNINDTDLDFLLQYICVRNPKNKIIGKIDKIITKMSRNGDGNTPVILTEQSGIGAESTLRDVKTFTSSGNTDRTRFLPRNSESSLDVFAVAISNPLYSSSVCTETQMQENPMAPLPEMGDSKSTTLSEPDEHRDSYEMFNVNRGYHQKTPVEVLREVNEMLKYGNGASIFADVLKYYVSARDCELFILEVLGYYGNLNVAVAKLFYLLMSIEIKSLFVSRYTFRFCSAALKDIVMKFTFGHTSLAYITMWRKIRGFSLEVDAEIARFLDGICVRDGIVMNNRGEIHDTQYSPYLRKYVNAVKIYMLIYDRKPETVKLFTSTVSRWLESGEIRTDDILIINAMKEKKFPVPYFIYTCGEKDVCDSAFGRQGITDYAKYKFKKSAKPPIRYPYSNTCSNVPVLNENRQMANPSPNVRESQMVSDLIALFENNKDSETIAAFLPGIMDTIEPMYEAANEILIRHRVYENIVPGEEILSELRVLKYNLVA